LSNIRIATCQRTNTQRRPARTLISGVIPTSN
jgi:hypothetical protein